MSPPFKTIVAPILLAALLFRAVPTAQAITLNLTPTAIEQTLRRQLFTSPGNIYYLRGAPTTPCHVTAQNPHLTLANNRIFLNLHVEAHIGEPFGDRCLGIDLTRDVQLSMLPAAQGSSIGFTQARIEHLSGSQAVDTLLAPFMATTIPTTLHVDTATLVTQILAHSRQTTGYTLQLTRFQIQSAAIQNNHMIITADGTLNVE